MSTKEMRELDAWVAENVFGWHKVRPNLTNNSMCDNCNDKALSQIQKHYNESFIHVSNTLPHYTTDPSAAFEVLKKCQLKVGVLIRQFGDNYLVCATNNDGETLHSCFTSTTLELAICMFAKQLFVK